MRICCLSDLHGHLPEVPDCELLLLAGDYCPMSRVTDQMFWMRDLFSPWINGLAAQMKIVGVAGNHDFIFENSPHLVPRMNWVYLQDQGTETLGLKVWGSPWQPRFYDWAFNADEPELRDKWDLIPEGTDVLLLHGPPRGYGDFSPYGKESTGSPSLTERIFALKPKLVVAGHIHSGYGRYQIGDTCFVNAAQMDEEYRPINKPIIVEL